MAIKEKAVVTGERLLETRASYQLNWVPLKHNQTSSLCGESCDPDEEGGKVGIGGVRMQFNVHYCVVMT